MKHISLWPKDFLRAVEEMNMILLNYNVINVKKPTKKKRTKQKTGSDR